MQQNEMREIVATGELKSYRFRTERRGLEVLHRITVTGPINLKRRIPLYEATLAANASSNYFCILDNRAGFENSFAFEEMQILSRLMQEAGISHLYGVTITDDQEYPKIVELANIVIKMSTLQGELLSTSDPDEAETFIRCQLDRARLCP
ncbi:MAG: hypothetical protein P1U37_01675 [Minwuia sp.]|nr:hypothetical protein [Minwuia sp.]